MEALVVESSKSIRRVPSHRGRTVGVLGIRRSFSGMMRAPRQGSLAIF